MSREEVVITTQWFRMQNIGTYSEWSDSVLATTAEKNTTNDDYQEHTTEQLINARITFHHFYRPISKTRMVIQFLSEWSYNALFERMYLPH